MEFCNNTLPLVTRRHAPGPDVDDRSRINLDRRKGVSGTRRICASYARHATLRDFSSRTDFACRGKLHGFSPSVSILFRSRIFIDARGNISDIALRFHFYRGYSFRTAALGNSREIGRRFPRNLEPSYPINLQTSIFGDTLRRPRKNESRPTFSANSYRSNR